MVDDEEILELVELEVRELLDDLRVPRRRHPGHPRLGAQGARGRRRVGRASSSSSWTRSTSSIPTPEREIDKPFLMPIEDVFTITGRGTVVTGRIERGIVKVNETVEIVGHPRREADDDRHRRRDVPQAARRGPGRRERRSAPAWHQARGRRARPGRRASPASITPHTEFEAQVYILSKDEGGRHTPFFNNYRPQFYFRTTDVTGVVTLPEGTEMVMPGDNTAMTVDADPADRDGGGPALRHPRGRPHRRRRPGHQDHQVDGTPRVRSGRRHAQPARRHSTGPPGPSRH